MSGSEPGRREVAYRLFAAEFDDSEFSYSESDEERSPNYVVTPTGARVNRLFAVGVLTEVDDVNPEMVRGRIVDPTGAFVSYAGQYQPEALAFLERADPPTFVALSGKARTFEPDDGDQIYTSVRPESVSEVDAETRDRWVVTAAERTIDRIGIMASAIEAELAGDQLRAALVEAGVDDRLADGVALALDYYDTTPAYLDALRETALDAARVVAGERDDVRSLDLAPDEGMGDASALATLDLSDAPSPTTAAAAAGVEDGDVEASAEPDVSESAEEPAETDVSETPEESEPVEETEVPAETESETEAEPETAEPTAEAEGESVEEPDEPEADEEVREEVEEELEDFDPGEFDLDEETREQVEEEYGTEFSTADEVEDADIETPEAETPAEEGGSEPDETESEAEAEATEETDSEPEPEEEPADESEAEEAAEAAGEVDLEDAVMETMEELDEGDGADHDELVESVVESQGVAADDVEDAIQDALMSGRCYEPSDGTLKSI